MLAEITRCSTFCAMDHLSVGLQEKSAGINIGTEVNKFYARIIQCFYYLFL